MFGFFWFCELECACGLCGGDHLTMAIDVFESVTASAVSAGGASSSQREISAGETAGAAASSHECGQG